MGPVENQPRRQRTAAHIGNPRSNFSDLSEIEFKKLVGSVVDGKKSVLEGGGVGDAHAVAVEEAAGGPVGLAQADGQVKKLAADARGEEEENRVGR